MSIIYQLIPLSVMFLRIWYSFSAELSQPQVVENSCLFDVDVYLVSYLDFQFHILNFKLFFLSKYFQRS